jgi:transposase
MAINEQKLSRDLEIVRLSKENLTATEILLKMKLPRSTVRNIIKKHKKFNTVLRLPGSGRKKSLNKEDLNIILSEIDKDPFTSSEKIKNRIESEAQKKFQVEQYAIIFVLQLSGLECQEKDRTSLRKI